MTEPNIHSFAEPHVVRDRHSCGPAAQLCSWLLGFCGALLGVLIGLVIASSERGEPSRRVDGVVHVPDPDYLVKRCDQPRTGFVTADLPSCPDRSPVSLAADG